MRAVAVTHVFPRHEGDPSAPFLLTWAHALQEAGADLTVVAPHDAELPRYRAVGGVPVRFVRYGPDCLERLAYRGEMHLLARRPTGPPLVATLLAAMAVAVRAEVRRAQPDLLHVHWWLPGAVIARLARVDVPIVVTVHGTDVALIERRPRLAALARWALTAADRVEAVSTDLAKRVERTTGRAAEAINPMPLPADRLYPLQRSPRDADGPLRVLAIGRLVSEKGFADVITAVARLQCPTVLTIVGEGPQRERLAAEAQGLGVALRLPGSLNPAGLRAAYREADVVVQASHREGLGLVAAEALAMGLPVIATDSGGARDVLDHLVPVGDVDALAERLTTVAADPQAARLTATPYADHVRARLSPTAATARTLAGWRAISRCSRPEA